MILENADYFVRLVDFPAGVRCKAMTLLNDDGTFSIYLNARFSAAALFPAFIHERQHIENDDFYGDRLISDIEESI